MNELIWYSVPGSMIVLAVICNGWLSIDETGNALLTGGVVPLVGFIVHQLFRCLFEQFFGFDSERRKVIEEIKTKLRMERRDAFLTWEIAFYSNEFPESFREHNRRGWHYILSFWSGTTAAILSLLILVVPCVCDKNGIDFSLAIAFLIIASILAWKGRLTFSSISEQEAEFFNRNRKLFKKRT